LGEKDGEGSYIKKRRKIATGKGGWVPIRGKGLEGEEPEGLETENGRDVKRLDNKYRGGHPWEGQTSKGQRGKQSRCKKAARLEGGVWFIRGRGVAAISLFSLGKGRSKLGWLHRRGGKGGGPLRGGKKYPLCNEKKRSLARKDPWEGGRGTLFSPTNATSGEKC